MDRDRRGNHRQQNRYVAIKAAMHAAVIFVLRARSFGAIKTPPERADRYSCVFARAFYAISKSASRRRASASSSFSVPRFSDMSLLARHACVHLKHRSCLSLPFPLPSPSLSFSLSFFSILFFTLNLPCGDRARVVALINF